MDKSLLVGDQVLVWVNV